MKEYYIDNTLFQEHDNGAVDVFYYGEKVGENTESQIQVTMTQFGVSRLEAIAYLGLGERSEAAKRALLKRAKQKPMSDLQKYVQGAKFDKETGQVVNGKGDIICHVVMSFYEEQFKVDGKLDYLALFEFQEEIGKKIAESLRNL